MRDIKFRGKNKEGKWIYGTGVVKVIVNCKETNALEIIQSVDYDELDYYVPNYDSEEIRPETIGQYTGLKDENGKEIYENMIINNKYIVIFDFCKFALKNKDNGEIIDFERNEDYEITGEYFK